MQKDKNLDMIGQMLDTNKLSKPSDNVLKMLYDMIPEKVKEYMLLPYMKRLVEKCEKQEGYKTFLLELYGSIEFGDGDMEYDTTFTSKSSLYQLITYIYGNSHDYISPDTVDDIASLPSTAYCILDQSENECVAVDEVPDSYIDRYGEPDVCGNIYTLDFDEIFDDDFYSNVVRNISDINFPLYEEYIDFLQEYEDLYDEYSYNSGRDLFDVLD